MNRAPEHAGNLPRGGGGWSLLCPTQISGAATSPRKHHRYPPPLLRYPSYHPRCLHRHRPPKNRRLVLRRRGSFPPLCCSFGCVAPRCPSEASLWWVGNRMSREKRVRQLRKEQSRAVGYDGEENGVGLGDRTINGKEWKLSLSLPLISTSATAFDCRYPLTLTLTLPISLSLCISLCLRVFVSV